MRTRRSQAICLLTLTVVLLVQAPGAFAAAANCNSIDPTLKGPAMSEKLTRCNSVLKPSKPTDPDIIVPAPIVNDPLTIQPKNIPGNKNGQAR